MVAVSVVIPTYNGSRFVGETVRAALGQTLAPVEVIVVDDESTDNTPEVVQAFPEVRYMRVSNGGTGRARNEGVKVAKGTWIAFCDHDDLWRPTYLETFAAGFKPESRYGFGNWVDILESTWGQGSQFAGTSPDFFSDLSQPLYQKLIRHIPIRPSATIIKKTFFDEIGGFNPKFSRYATEDTEFTLRANEYPDAVVLHDPLVGIRKHQRNYSKGRVRQLLSDAAIFQWCSEHQRLGRVYRQELLDAAAANRLRALDEAFSEGDMSQVREIALLLPPSLRTSKAALKIGIAQSRIVPGTVVRRMVGRSNEQFQTGVYADAPATPE